MIKVIKASKAVHRKISKSYDIWALLTRNTSKKVSLALGKAVNHSEICRNMKSDRVYYVLSGLLKVRPAKGGKWTVAKPGDAIFIKAGTQYHFAGTFKAVQANAPPFDPKNEPAKYNKVIK